jgi:hypothetical protein|tara:strand:- start:18067 stop:18276 length:210 start_codon:yes stop_codon:yes gene_type:complete
MKVIEQKIRYFIDLDFKGDAKGGIFIRCSLIKNKIRKIESDGKTKVVGLVYDGTDDLEIVTIQSKELPK